MVYLSGYEFQELTTDPETISDQDCSIYVVVSCTAAPANFDTDVAVSPSSGRAVDILLNGQG